MTTTCPFDHHSREHAEDPVAVYKAIREGEGHAHSDAHGGFTVFAKYADVTGITQDTEHFSSALEVEGDDHVGGGITLPHNPAAQRMSLAEMDGEEWRRIRRLLNPLFTPAGIAHFQDRIREITTERIDTFIESGRCDLVLDIASPIPAIVTLEYLGIDTSEWERYAVPVHASTFTPRDPANPAFQKIAGDFGWIFDQIRDEIARRRETPVHGDLLAAMMEVNEDGAGLSDEEVFEAVYTTIAAGVDTTTSLLSTAFWHLDGQPDDRQRLINEPELIPVACEEFLRFYSPSQAGARTVTKPVTVDSVSLVRGDRVLISWASASRDAEVFDRPDEFVIDRKPNRHVGFGFGIHRCIGLHLARQEFRIVLEEMVQRMPDFTIDRENTPRYPDVGLMFGYQQMPATFTPATAPVPA